MIFFKIEANFPFLESPSSGDEPLSTLPAAAPVLGIVFFLEMPWQKLNPLVTIYVILESLWKWRHCKSVLWNFLKMGITAAATLDQLCLCTWMSLFLNSG